MTAPPPAGAHHYVAIYCDHARCAAEHRADVWTGDGVDGAYAVLRAELTGRLGWACDNAGDWCPLHRPES